MNLWSTLPNPAIPAPGDMVTRSSCFEPLAVRSHHTDNYGQLWLTLSDGSSERVECLRWCPQVGDKVTVNIAVFAKGLKTAMEQAPENSAEIMTLKKYSNDLTSPSSWVYRNHTIDRINEDRATILDSKGVARSIGLSCLVVVERVTASQKPHEQLSLL